MFHILKIINGDEVMFQNCGANDNGNFGFQQQQQNCNSRVINPTTLGECSNQCYPPFGRPGPVVVKVPVVLSDVKIQIDVESDIRIEEPAFDIKTIDKRVCITQCKLVPFTKKLFIAGFVQKNIQYSTVTCANATSVSGDIRHTTVNIPFRCFTAIRFDKMPIFGKSFKTRLNALDDNMMCDDVNEDSWVHFNKPFEPIFCELEWSKILETDILDRDINCAAPFTTERCFQNITEKMVVYIRVKVLQKQQVCIPEPHCDITMIKECDCDYYEHDDEKYCEDIEICCLPEKGMVGRHISQEKY